VNLWSLVSFLKVHLEFRGGMTRSGGLTPMVFGETMAIPSVEAFMENWGTLLETVLPSGSRELTQVV
jgi:hypothetical protein